MNNMKFKKCLLIWNIVVSTSLIFLVINYYTNIIASDSRIYSSVLENRKYDIGTFVDVKDLPFNAKGDGKTDDGPAIQKAIDYAYLHNLAVYLPEGKYRIATAIRLPDHITIRGSNRYHTVLSEMGKCECKLIMGVSPMFIGKNAGTASKPYVCKLTLTDLAFDNPLREGNVFEYFTLEDSLVEYCFFRGFSNVIVGNLRKITRIMNNTFLSISKSAISNDMLQGTEAWSGDSWISNNYFNGAKNYLSNKTIPVNIRSSTTLWIQSNYFDNCYTAVSLYSCDWFKVTQNHFGYVYKAIWMEENTCNTIVSENTFSNCTNKYAGRFENSPEDIQKNGWNCISGKLVHDLSISNNKAGNCDVLISLADYGYYNIKTNGNSLDNTGHGGKLFDLDLYPSKNPQTNKGISLEELNYVTVSVLPGNNQTFDGNIVFYKNRLCTYIYPEKKWRDVSGNIIK